MDTFGDRLRSEREDRGMTIETVAGILAVDEGPLRALERNDFRALPDESAMLACLRAYADCLEVDAELMIEDYLQERDRCLRQLEEALTSGAATPEAVAGPARVAQPYPRWVPISMLLAVTLAVSAWWLFSGDGTPSRPAPPDTATAVDTGAPRGATDAPPAMAEELGPIESPRSEPPAPRSVATAGDTGRLSISEDGLGTGVKNRRLVGRGDRFREGTQVYFWTQVEGGRRGDRIEHVWMRDGVVAASIGLKVGGPRWRTYSAKSLHAGAGGDWAVEARDSSGRVLARREFVCLP